MPMLTAPARYVSFSLSLVLLAGTIASAQNYPGAPNGDRQQRTGQQGTARQTPTRNPFANVRFFGGYDPSRNADYGAYHPGPTENEIHHYNRLPSPFTYYRPRYRSYYNRYNYSNFTYANGLYTNGIFNYDWAYTIFPNGVASYPYYVPDFIPGGTYFSPYSYYAQAPGYILADTVYLAPPQVIYVPVPVYADGAYRGFQRADIDDYYLNRAPKQDDGPTVGGKNGAAQNPQASATPQERLIDKAAADIAKAWKSGDIQSLSAYIDPNAKISISLRGKYQYSLDARDYLDLTRDAFAATKTVRFEMDAPVRKERGVYLLTERHVYQNKDGAERTVYVNYVLELKDDKYQITQVGSAPDKVDNYKVGE